MSHVRIEKPSAGTSVIVMDRPERMNSLAFELVVPLHEAFAQVAADNDTGVVILTGVGRGFCSGADHKDSTPPPNIAGLTLTRIATRAMTILAELVPSMRRLPQPVICAVNGAAIGGGMCLALGGDIRIAAESAYFRAAGINNGLTATELGMSFLLPRAIGASRAFEIMLSGRDVTAREAAEIGLVSRVVPDAELLLWAGLEAGSLQAAIELESHTQLYVRLTTQNFEEATRARKEGRKPVFKD